MSDKPPRYCELLQNIRIVTFAPEISMVQITLREQDYPYITKIEDYDITFKSTGYVYLLPASHHAQPVQILVLCFQCLGEHQCETQYQHPTG